MLLKRRESVVHVSGWRGKVSGARQGKADKFRHERKNYSAPEANRGSEVKAVPV